MSVFELIERDDVDGLRALLATDAVDLEAFDDDLVGKSPLHSAAISGKTECVRILLDAGASVNKMCKIGYSALHWASRMGKVDTVRVLLDAGADIKAITTGARYGDTALHFAAESGHADTVRVLLDAGAEIDKLNFYNSGTALHVAFQIDQPFQTKSAKMEIVRVLLDAGADIERTNERGQNALHFASKRGNADAVRLLLDAGTDVNKTDKGGWTALHSASATDSTDTVRVLLDAGADIEMATTDSGWTALHWASRCNSKMDAVRVLLDAGADIKKADSAGWTALHWASVTGRADTVHVLLETGAEVDASDTRGRTPLVVTVTDTEYNAPASERYHVARALCDRGAQYDAPAPEAAKQEHRGRNEADELRSLTGLYVCVMHWIKQRAADRSDDLTHIPEETFTQGAEAVESYLASLAQTEASQIVRRRKVCVVGPSCSGKTSFVKSLSKTMPVLEEEEDRTIGIDLFAVTFEADATAASSRTGDGKYETSIWDFAGQDIYQVAHTLYFSKRTLYLVFVSLEAYAKQLEDLSMQATNASEVRMSRWVQDNVFRWVRLVLARQPDAELVLVCSKADAATADQADEVLRDLNSRLDKWVAQLVNEMDGPAKDAAHKSVSEFQGRGRLRVSVIKQEAVDAALQDLQLVVAEQRERAFVMPRMYTKVYEAIQKMRTEFETMDDPAERVKKVLVPSGKLVSRLSTEIDGLKEHECRHILATLHYLGDILWYEQERRLATIGLDTIILDPRIMLDIVREVVNHTLEDAIGDDYEALRDRGELKHSLLTTFKLWGELSRQSQDLVLYLKQLLQRFNLAYPVGNQEMAWDSDLIVPSYWKSKRQLVQPESEDAIGVEEPAAFHVTWQYTLPAEVSETLFDQFIVRSYTVNQDRRVSATAVDVAQADRWRARIRFLSDRKPSENLVTISVSAHTSDDGWSSLKSLVMAMEQVLHGYPGLGMVHRHLVHKSASGKEKSFDLKRVIEKNGARLSSTVFAVIQDKLSVLT